VANDGDAAALGEARFGAGRNVRNLLYVTVSTGIGGGIVVDGRLYRGERAWAGEVGHLVLDPSGPVCSCGRHGCLEALASGTAIAREARRRSLPDGSTARDVAQAAAGGDVIAAEIWADAMQWLGLGIVSAANLLDPGCVVLGGGLTDAGAQLFDPVRATVAARALDPELEVVPTELGASVGLVGAAAVAIAAAGD
jgi:glucokinase